MHVCAELQRVARAGYVEVPSRLEEQSAMDGHPGVGWSHHRWLIDVDDDAKSIEFVFKHGVVYTAEAARFPPGFHATLTAAERVSSLWWDGSFAFGERVMMSADELDPYLADFVDAELRRRGIERPGPARRLAQRTQRALASLRQPS